MRRMQRLRDEMHKAPLILQRCKIHSMVRTQIQLPDEIYRRARQLAKSREISMAELVRRSLELLMSQYPDPASTLEDWSMPKPMHLGWKGLDDSEIKEFAQMSSMESELTSKSAAKMKVKKNAKL
jgi:hypothetical protein